MTALSTVELDVKAIDDGATGVFHAVLSTERLDRDNERLQAKCFEPLPKSLPVFADHKHTTDFLIGSGTPYYNGDALKLSGKFAGTPRAQNVRQLVLDGHLGAMSVGFTRAKRVTRNNQCWVVKGELVEASFVGIGSNEDAMVTAVRSATPRDDDLQRRAREIQERVDADEDLRRRKFLIQTQLQLLSGDIDRMERRERDRRYDSLKRTFAAMGDKRTVRALERIERFRR